MVLREAHVHAMYSIPAPGEGSTAQRQSLLIKQAWAEDPPRVVPLIHGTDYNHGLHFHRE